MKAISPIKCCLSCYVTKVTLNHRSLSCKASLVKKHFRPGQLYHSFAVEFITYAYLTNLFLPLVIQPMPCNQYELYHTI
ncbi:hypothetical protein T01_5822 [Trichinella spiralis]|uniref:Uncharacterized protein n=1 Tax=Trichinella spiralis TaxID=6334 RepID=A0A0V1BNH3_TRISP|nr:hypothetical protein T01_5822 [Trichinella spiralis]